MKNKKLWIAAWIFFTFMHLVIAIIIVIWRGMSASFDWNVIWQFPIVFIISTIPFESWSLFIIIFFSILQALCAGLFWTWLFFKLKQKTLKT